MRSCLTKAELGSATLSPIVSSILTSISSLNQSVAVLDQEEAKKFLTGKEEDKYAFFTKATELERLDRTYANIQDAIEEQQESGARAKQAMETSVENVKRLKREWEQFRELDKLEAECQVVRLVL